MEKHPDQSQATVWVSRQDQDRVPGQGPGLALDSDWELGAERALVLELSLALDLALSEEELQEQGQERCQEPELVPSAMEEEQLADQEPQQVQLAVP